MSTIVAIKKYDDCFQSHLFSSPAPLGPSPKLCTDICWPAVQAAQGETQLFTWGDGNYALNLTFSNGYVLVAPAKTGAVGWMSKDIAGCPVWTVLKLA